MVFATLNSMLNTEIIIDGYNLLHKLFPAGGGSSLEQCRKKTEALLERYRKKAKCSVTIVYDGGGIRDTAAGAAVLIVYTASSKSADRWIIDYVKSLNTSRKMVTIVSSDREVCLYGKAYGAECLTSEEFITLLDPENIKGSPGCSASGRKYSDRILDDREVEQWKLLFERGKR